MASQAIAAPKKVETQMMLFSTEVSKRPDGSFVIVPVKIYQDREIGVKAAMKHLGYRCKKRIYALLEQGKIRGWKPEGDRGNAKWRIYEASVIAYKEGRTEAAARGEA